MANIILRISSGESTQNLRNHLVNGSKRLHDIMYRIASIATQKGEVQLLKDDSASATGTVTVAVNGNVADGDTIQIGDTVFTAKTSGATGHQFNIGGTATLTAANFVTVFNANAAVDFGGKVGATNAAGVITLTCLVPGFLGNLINIAVTVATPGAITKAGTRFGGGADDSAVSINFKNL